MRPLSLYIHFPYCLYKCHYCDFNSYAVKDISGLQEPYIRALLEELDAASRSFELEAFDTIFLGGGTPSLFHPKFLEDLLQGISRRVGIRSDAEITLEANPKTLQGGRVREYAALGINRFSVGIQSFQDRFLAPLGRLHDAQEALETLTLLAKEGVRHNFDLMFGFPGQSLEDLQSDLEIASRFTPQHLSFYGLTLEPGTLFAEHQRQGRLQLPDEDLQAQMYELGVEHFEGRGYALYEISNFAQPGQESRHNLAYWKYLEYLGLGAGAVSFLRAERLRAEACQEDRSGLYGFRWTNLKSPEQYRKAPAQSYKSRAWEEIDPATAQKEFWMMGLRLRQGVRLSEFEERFGAGSAQAYQEALQDWTARGCLDFSGGVARLTARGRLLANEVVSSFFI